MVFRSSGDVEAHPPAEEIHADDKHKESDPPTPLTAPVKSEDVLNEKSVKNVSEEVVEVTPETKEVGGGSGGEKDEKKSSVKKEVPAEQESKKIDDSIAEVKDDYPPSENDNHRHEELKSPEQHERQSRFPIFLLGFERWLRLID